MSCLMYLYKLGCICARPNLNEAGTVIPANGSTSYLHEPWDLQVQTGLGISEEWRLARSLSEELNMDPA